MHRNKIWLAFLTLIALAALWFSGASAYKVYHYSTLSKTTNPTSIEWDIVKLGVDRYAAQAKYTYSVEDKTYQNEETLSRLIFRNTFAAKQTLPELSQKAQTIWYAPKTPQYSTLDKSFPLKQLIYAGIVWILFFYFIWLGFYVRRKNKIWK